MKRIILVLLISGAFSLLQNSPALAVPITYELSGSLEIGDIGSSITQDIVNSLNMDVFGTWTGTMTYDVDTVIQGSDIMTSDGYDAGEYYSEQGITEMNIELNNGLSLTTTTGSVTVYTGDVEWLPIGYSVGSGFTIPAEFWDSTPSSYLDYYSFFGVSVGGVESTTTDLGLPPLTLDTVVAGGIQGFLFFDVDNDDVINSYTETIEITGSLSSFAQTTAPVPEPTTMLLLGSGLIGLVGFRKNLKKK